ncbi:DNA-3-methyladenine glycosylase I [Halioxenophilus aromaticivorans]|uniref:DNA-3-methyladenine glycosylase I n=1 Tax=Halioxenophilus aromaticivorans TaxID=1306992 RepID=A0AAV3U6C0_9ALTE
MTVPFEEIKQRAIGFKGRSAVQAAHLPAVKTDQKLIDQSDAFYLSTMTRRIFQAGLKHSVINARWPAFEAAFANFDPYTNAMMSDDEMDAHMANTKLIRHLGKMKSIRHNANLVLEVAREYGSFGRFLAQWPGSDIVDLWGWLKKRGNQLGGMSGARFLRMAGKDTFLITEDIVALLRSLEVVDKTPTAKRDLAKVQAVFNEWQAQSGLPLSHISRIASYTVNTP